MAEETEKWIYFLKKLNWSEILNYLFLKVAMIFVVISTVLTIYNGFTDNSTLFCEKTTIQNKLKTVIRNGGNLDDVKDVYRKRFLKKSSITNSLDNDDYYKEDVPLSEVLSDLRIKYFLEKEQRRYSYKTHVIKDSILVDADSLYFSLLNKIIDEHKRKNPFDVLEPNQRDILNNIQQKLDTGYVEISGDVSKIVSELSNKNQIVTKYLNLSEKSYWLAWGAIILTIVFAFIQIRLNIISSNKHNKRLDEIEKKINDKE